MKKLSEAEKHCWDYIQENLARIPQLSISKLSEEAHVSLSTVSRTLKRKGYEGYKEFKESIRHDKKGNIKTGFSREVSEAIRKNQVEIDRTIRQLSPEAIEEAVKMINVHNKIVIFSAGLSSSVARGMLSKLQLFGKNCVSHDDADYMQYYANRSNEETLVIVISISGETPELVSAVKKAKNHKAQVIALTANETSTLAVLADVQLPAYKTKLQEIDFGLDVGSRIPLQVVTRILLDSFAIYKKLFPIRDF